MYSLYLRRVRGSDRHHGFLGGCCQLAVSETVISFESGLVTIRATDSHSVITATTGFATLSIFYKGNQGVRQPKYSNKRGEDPRGLEVTDNFENKPPGPLRTFSAATV